MTIQDIQIIVIQMMTPVQIQVVVIVAAMIKKLVIIIDHAECTDTHIFRVVPATKWKAVVGI